MFGNKITKIISIEGMHCAHCVKRIEEALKDLKEVKSVKVNLEDKNAEVVLKADVENEIFIRLCFHQPRLHRVAETVLCSLIDHADGCAILHAGKSVTVGARRREP